MSASVTTRMWEHFLCSFFLEVKTIRNYLHDIILSKLFNVSVSALECSCEQKPTRQSGGGHLPEANEREQETMCPVYWKELVLGCHGCQEMLFTPGQVQSCLRADGRVSGCVCVKMAGLVCKKFRLQSAGFLGAF